jgi:diacylglycerol kinase family enzyme
VPPRSLTIVLNTGSGATAGGGAAEDARTAIEGVLGPSGVSFELVVPADGEDLSAAAARAVQRAGDGGGAVVAAGGDGTINTVAQAVLGTGVPFGVLARGTFNYFARSHGLPVDTAEACRVLLDPDVREVQVGRLTGGKESRVFLVNASLGLYPTLLEDREAWKDRFGRNRLVALGAALATLLQRHRRLDLRIATEGGGTREVRTTTLFVGNNRMQLEKIGVAEAPQVEAGELAVLAVLPVGSLEMLGLALRGALGRLGDAEATVSFATASLEVVQAGRPRGRLVKVATDGEVCRLAMPLVFEVARERLSLLVPKGGAAS